MDTGFFLGIDTSNYTTSAAAVTAAGEVFYAKRPLAVASGKRGLRQSDALFCHTRDLSAVVEECLAPLKQRGKTTLLGVGVSATPRRVEGSYMPCFLAGQNAAGCLAAAADVPLFEFSHQEGHLEAARYGTALRGRPLEAEEFLAFHLSGGTTELLHVKRDGIRYEARIVSEVLDLTCGQLLDRCGVKLGLSFPAGAALEELALTAKGRYSPKIPKKEGGINLSGFENQFDAAQKRGEAPAELAAFAFAVVRNAIAALLEGSQRENLPVLFSGGVASSRLLQAAFSGERYYFSPPAFCTDNAVGIAEMTRKGVQNGSRA